MPTELEKLEAHADHLMGCFLGLAERYYVLRPLMFDAKVQSQLRSPSRATGFESLRRTLFSDCVQGLVNLAFDTGKKTPSATKIIDKLSRKQVADTLRERFSRWSMGAEEDESAALRQWRKDYEARRQQELREQFNLAYHTIQENWTKFQELSAIPTFRVIRDKVASHVELCWQDGTYRLVGLPSPVTGRELEYAMSTFENVVVNINLVVRQAGFMIEDAREQLRLRGEALWSLPC